MNPYDRDDKEKECRHRILKKIAEASSHRGLTGEGDSREGR